MYGEGGLRSGSSRRIFWTVSVASSIRSIGFGATWPYMAIYFKQELDLPTVEVGVIFTLLSATSVIFSLFGGALADFMGRRRTLLTGSFGGFLIYVSIAFFIMSGKPDIWIISFFIISSFSGSLVFPSASALVSDVTTESERFKAFSIYRILGNVGWAIGPLIGSYIYDTGVELVFIFVAVSSIIQFMIVLLLVKEEAVPNRWTDGTRGKRFNLLSFDRYLIFFGLGTFLITVVASQFSVTLPTYSVIHVGIKASQLGYIYAVNGLVVVLGQYPMTALMRRFSDVTTMTLGAVLYGFGYLLVGFSDGLLPLMLDMIVITSGENLTSPGINTIVSKIAPQDRTARYMGFIGMLNSTGRSLGPSIGTMFLSVYAYSGLSTWSSISAFAGASVLILLSFGKIPYVVTRLSKGARTEAPRS